MCLIRTCVPCSAPAACFGTASLSCSLKVPAYCEGMLTLCSGSCLAWPRRQRRSVSCPMQSFIPSLKHCRRDFASGGHGFCQPSGASAQFDGSSRRRYVEVGKIGKVRLTCFTAGKSGKRHTIHRANTSSAGCRSFQQASFHHFLVSRQGGLEGRNALIVLLPAMLQRWQVGLQSRGSILTLARRRALMNQRLHVSEATRTTKYCEVSRNITKYNDISRNIEVLRNMTK